VRALLSKSEAFRALPPEAQREIAHNTVQVATYLAEPGGVRTNETSKTSTTESQPSRDPYALNLADTSGRRPAKEGQFVAQGAREGAQVAGALLKAVNFPEFVSGLIQGVFHAIVQSSIEQMEAYGKLVADVAKSLNQFRDENVSVNQGRDHLVEQYPDLFKIDIDTGSDGQNGPRVRLKDGVDESAALKRVNSMPVEGGTMDSLEPVASNCWQRWS
jgi:hypothetical protein